MPRSYDRKRTLPPPSNHRVTLKQAATLTRNYRESIPAADKTGFFHAQAVRDLLKQPGVVGVRYYHGLDSKGCYHLVLVGVDKEGRDIVESKRNRPRDGAKAITQESAAKGALAIGTCSAVILDNHYPCPPWCPPPGPLNA